MEDDEGGPRLSKRFSDKDGGEVDFKTKAGTAWSHNFLNQKPWHPLSYPNQRRKWIAEQTHSQRHRRAEEIAREYSQEQEYLRQTSLLSQKEKEKVDIMQAVSFMYVRPPGYNAESAKAAEIADERRKLGESEPTAASSSSMPQEVVAVKEEKKKTRPKDVFGRTLPTEEEFAVLKNAPRLETGVTGRAKPFAVELRNVKCVRCGTYGHQSGDRECPLKDAIMPNDENRLKRDDPLTAIMAQMDPSEPLKWELKQRPGISPPRGGFQPDDPNQQIVPEDIFDEYGGFLSGGNIPELLTNFSSMTHKKKSKSKSHHKHESVSHRKDHEGNSSASDGDNDQRSSKMKSKNQSKQKRSSHRQSHEGNNPASNNDSSKMKGKRSSSKHKKRELHLDSDQESDSTSDSYEHKRRSRKRHMRNKRNRKDLSHFSMSEDSMDESCHGKSRYKDSHRYRKSKVPHEVGPSEGERKSSRKGETCRHKNTHQNDSEFSISEDSESERHTRKHRQAYSSKVIDSKDHHRSLRHR
ncbi:hypothetical protein SOVF_150380 [Spinacia oleracea]|uniref:Uncharacterized zinc finger CCHC domain-containing protein At4g19190 n=1 Tax=Spinacia oleracea TaxID=3562 RepID=A0A9R0IWZ1_SPIOL|nr:uncharacterized zinc finger CCHC domain-containing protein At4g19190 [Spinacia oleracea]KNA09786.1 hypothetical protein SOVF_150380 [Spinacia oleracea]